MSSPAEQNPTSRASTWAALALMLGLVFWMQTGPFVRQILHWKLPYGTMAWQMYHGKGADVCIVDWQLDGVSFDPGGPRRRRYHNQKDVLKVARQLCARGDVRADARCAVRPDGAWRQVVSPEETLCSP